MFKQFEEPNCKTHSMLELKLVACCRSRSADICAPKHEKALNLRACNRYKRWGCACCGTPLASVSLRPGGPSQPKGPHTCGGRHYRWGNAKIAIRQVTSAA